MYNVNVDLKKQPTFLLILFLNQNLPKIPNPRTNPRTSNLLLHVEKIEKKKKSKKEKKSKKKKSKKESKNDM